MSKARNALFCEGCGAPLGGLDLLYCEDCRDKRYGIDGSSCVEGMECPSCGNVDRFNIEVKTTVLVGHGGVEADGSDTEWDDKSFCSCDSEDDECGYDGKVAQFRRSNKDWKRDRKKAIKKQLKEAADVDSDS